MRDFRDAFIQFAIQNQALQFGEYTTKAGRRSPYFFNAGKFYDGLALSQLAGFYAQAVRAANIDFDMLFGPAYKGILLAGALAMQLSDENKKVHFCFDRKEAKNHGEKGALIGAPLQGKVLIVDDVITGGGSIREAAELIQSAGAQVAGVVIALDRAEKGQHDISAVKEIEQRYNTRVCSVASLIDVIKFLQNSPDLHHYLSQVKAYQAQYGIENT